jgi:hypothetical protein
LTVTPGNAKVGVAVTVGDNSIVGVKVIVGSDVAVGVDVEVGSGVSVNSFVAVLTGAVEVGCCVEGAQAETTIKINKMILYIFIETLPENL